MKRFIVLTFAFAAISLRIAFGQVPQQITYQGYVHDSFGYPINGLHTMTISLFNNEFGGQILFNEPQNVVFNNGYFSTIIGSVSYLGDILLTDEVWIQTAIDDGSPFPRTKLMSFPFSLISQKSYLSDSSLFAATVADGSITQVKLSPGIRSIPMGEAGGDLMGFYPDPTINPDVIKLYVQKYVESTLIQFSLEDDKNGTDNNTINFYNHTKNNFGSTVNDDKPEMRKNNIFDKKIIKSHITVNNPDLQDLNDYSIIKITASGTVIMPKNPNEGQELIIINSGKENLKNDSLIIPPYTAVKFVYYGDWFLIK